MSINLLIAVQQNLGYPPLQKIDPNTQEMVIDNTTPNEDKFSQAAIPAVLISLCKYVQTNEGAEDVLKNNNTTNWVSKIFDKHSKEAVETIAAYAKEPSEAINMKLNLIANEAIKVAKESLGDTATIENMKVFFDNEKNNILLYLPAALHLGVLLHNNTLDDNTNKMEGPVSSLMQTIGSVFDSPTTDKDIEF